MTFEIALKTEKRRHCGFCELVCRAQERCVGCAACVDACPYEARVLHAIAEPRAVIPVTINHETYHVPAHTSVLTALETIGFTAVTHNEGACSDTEIHAPCRTGGCWSCAVLINGELKPSCVTPVEGGMEIVTERHELAKREPKRVFSGFQGHTVGGVGTLYWLKPRAFGVSY